MDAQPPPLIPLLETYRQHCGFHLDKSLKTYFKLNFVDHLVKWTGTVHDVQRNVVSLKMPPNEERCTNVRVRFAEEVLHTYIEPPKIKRRWTFLGKISKCVFDSFVIELDLVSSKTQTFELDLTYQRLSCMFKINTEAQAQKMLECFWKQKCVSFIAHISEYYDYSDHHDFCGEISVSVSSPYHDNDIDPIDIVFLHENENVYNKLKCSSPIYNWPFIVTPYFRQESRHKMIYRSHGYRLDEFISDMEYQDYVLSPMKQTDVGSSTSSIPSISPRLSSASLPAVPPSIAHALSSSMMCSMRGPPPPQLSQSTIPSTTYGFFPPTTPPTTQSTTPLPSSTRLPPQSSYPIPPPGIGPTASPMGYTAGGYAHIPPRSPS